MTSSADKENCGSPACGDGHEHDEGCDGRRDFLLKTTCAIGAVGAVSVAWPMVSSMNPAADVLALASTEVDVSQMKVGESLSTFWRGQADFHPPPHRAGNCRKRAPSRSVI